MRTEDMTPEQLEEVKSLQTPEEMFAYAKDNGIDLTEEEMDSISGGDWFLSARCPKCKSKNVVITSQALKHIRGFCKDCRYRF